MLPYLITGDDVYDWLGSDGARVIAIVAVAAAIDIALHRIIPRALRLTVERQMRDGRGRRSSSGWTPSHRSSPLADA